MKSSRFKKNEELQEDDKLEGEILSIVNEGTDNGAIKESEARMISNIFALDDTSAGEIATNRGMIVSVDLSMTIKEVIDIMLNHSFSRYPVLDGDIDHIVGILHLKDVFKAYNNSSKDDFVLSSRKDIIRKAKFVPENKVINKLFREMQVSKTQMVIVVDEYGQTTGIVSMEDILEQIVGNIQDEYDEDQHLIQKNAGQKSFKIDGFAPLEEVENLLGISFGQTNFDTINGYLTDKLGHIPAQEDKSFIFTFDNYEFQITDVEDKCIKQVVATPLSVKASKVE